MYRGKATTEATAASTAAGCKRLWRRPGLKKLGDAPLQPLPNYSTEALLPTFTEALLLPFTEALLPKPLPLSSFLLSCQYRNTRQVAMYPWYQ